MGVCRICKGVFGVPVYESPRSVSVTSLCQVLEGGTRVWCCNSCGHTQTEPLPALDKFYAEDYHILTANEQEDQLYALCDSRKIFRTEHQVGILLEKLDLRANAKVLDYGCGKASTLKELCAQRSDVEPHVYDVGEQYRSFWNSFVPEEDQAVCDLPDQWVDRFDAVISFFALEHVSDPHKFVSQVHRLLRESGTFYFLVPNLFVNPADLLVVDHINHFSRSSLCYLLEGNGFTVREVDDGVHTGAWMGVAEKGAAAASILQTDSVSAEVVDISTYWRAFSGRVEEFEKSEKDEAAIYGSGFYGTFIYTCLKQPERITCFLDQNPHRQKQTLMGKRIIAPEALPESIRRLYVGLNPSVAHEVLDGLDWGRALEVFYP